MEYKGKKRKFTVAEQKNIADGLKPIKAKYEEDKNNPKVNKSVWSENKRKWMTPFTQTGYIDPFFHDYFVNLKNEKLDSVEFKSAAEFVICCLDKLERGDFFTEGHTSKTNFRLLGAGPPKREVAVR